MAAASVPKPRDALAETSHDGNVFRDVISPDHPVFTPECGRYHLYMSFACPWANRCYAVIKMKGLENCISISVVHPTWQRTRPNDPSDTHCGWMFYDSEAGLAPLKSNSGYGSFAPKGCTADTVEGAKFIRDLYEMSQDISHKYSVPVLWDKKNHTIVNNESAEIVRMLTSVFDEWASGPYKALDLYPEALRATIDEINAWVYEGINDGVYKCGFAKSQTAYDEAVTHLYQSLDRAEELLSRQRYLAGGVFTEADVRLFMTLVRFDEVYVVYFKCNVATIRDGYPNLHAYCRDIYQHQLGHTIDMDHIKTHYFSSHPTLNAYSVIPRGPNALAAFSLPHNRDAL